MEREIFKVKMLEMKEMNNNFDYKSKTILKLQFNKEFHPVGKHFDLILRPKPFVPEGHAKFLPKPKTDPKIKKANKHNTSSINNGLQMFHAEFYRN